MGDGDQNSHGGPTLTMEVACDTGDKSPNPKGKPIKGTALNQLVIIEAAVFGLLESKKVSADADYS